MKIWLVQFEDLTCAWTKREDAISYFHEELKRVDATATLELGKEEEPDNFLVYNVVYEKNDETTAAIHPIFLDTKPYWD